MTRFTLVVAVALSIGACTSTKSGGGADSSATPAVPADVQTALAVKRGIAAAPKKTDSVLTANGLTAAGFDSLMYRIAADSALRAAFAAAR